MPENTETVTTAIVEPVPVARQSKMTNGEAPGKRDDSKPPSPDKDKSKKREERPGGREKRLPRKGVIGDDDRDPMPATRGRRDRSPMEEHHLRAIWQELGIGKDGYLTSEELSIVCRHIGMTDMGEKELRELFANLDSDHDRRISFHEFMSGLFQHAPMRKSTAPKQHHVAEPAPSPQPPPSYRDQQQYDRLAAEVERYKREKKDNEDEIRRLKAEIEDLKDRGRTEVLQQRRGMENVIIRLKEEETALKDTITDLTKEVDRLLQELIGCKKRILNLETLTDNQQSDLDSISDLHTKMMMEMASLSNSTELRDANDELLLEIELLRQQVNHKDADKYKGTVADFNLCEKLKKDFDFLINKYKKETEELKDQLDRTRQDFSLELKEESADLQDHFQRKIETLIRQFDDEKDNMRADFERERHEIETRIRREAELQFKTEREMLNARFQSERMALEQKHEVEKHQAVKQLEQDYKDELRQRIEGVRETFEHERSEKNESLSRMMDDWEAQKRLIREELTLQFNKETQNMRERFQSDRARIEEIHKMELRELEAQIEKGEHALTGKLKKDFDMLIERQREQLRQEEVAIVHNRFAEEKRQLQEEHDAEIARLRIRERQAFADEKQELVRKYERQLAKLEAEHASVPSPMAEITNAMLDQYQKQCEELAQRNAHLQEQIRNLEDKMSSLVTDNHHNVQAVEEEKHKLQREHQIKMAHLEKEVEDLRLKYDLRVGDINAKVEQIGELKIENEMLRQDKEQVENSLMDLEDTLNTKDEEVVQMKETISELKTEMKELELKFGDRLDNARMDKDRIQKQLREEEGLIHELKSELQEKGSSLGSQIDNMKKENNRLQEQLVQEENRIVACEQEKNVLVQHLRHANEQIASLTDRLGKTEKEHLKDLQNARDRLADYVDKNTFKEACDKLARAEKKIRDLESLLQATASGNDAKLQEAQQALRAAVKEAENQTDQTKKRLEVTKEMLKEKVDQLKQESEENRRNSRMAENLFKENARLIRSMHLAEDQLKKSESANNELEQKCLALQRCLKKVVREEEKAKMNY